MDVTNVSVGIAFVAGVLSFISPCMLPMIPAYVAYLGGRATMQTSVELATAGAAAPGPATVVRTNRLDTLIHGLFFVGGFTVVFVVFGLLINASIRLVAVGSYNLQTTIYHVGGVLIILFGLQVLGVTGWVLRFLTTRVDWQQMGTPGAWILHTLENIQGILYGDTRRQMNPRNGFGYAGSALMGVIFAAGWTPCVGPIIGSILTIAATAFTGDTLGKASSLLLAYSLGLGVPFLLASVALDRMRGLMKRIQRRSRVIELVSGGMLIVIGVLFVTDRFAYLNSMAGGLASVSYNLEACSTGILRGEFPAGDWGTCMKLGPNYQELMPKSHADPSVLAVLADGRILLIRGRARFAPFYLSSPE